MNLKKFIKTNEEFKSWVDGKKYFQKHTFGIYKNPKGDDIRTIIKEEKVDGFRILIDILNENIYLFDKELLHMDAKNSIKELKNIKKEMIKEGMANTDKEIIWVKGLSLSEKLGIKKWIKKTVLFFK